MPIRQEATPRDLPDPALIPEAPPAILTAATTAKERGDLFEAAMAEVAEAEAAVEQADAADQAADREALAESKPLPSAKAGPKARDAVKAAERKRDAAEANFKEAAAQLAAAIHKHGEEWQATVAKQREEATDAVQLALAVYRAAKVRVADLDQTAGSIRGFTERPHDPWSGMGFGHSPAIRRRRVGADPEHERAEVDRVLRTRRRFDNEHRIGAVLVELEYLATGERPWDESTRIQKGPLLAAKDGDRSKLDDGLVGFLLDYQEQARRLAG